MRLYFLYADPILNSFDSDSRARLFCGNDVVDLAACHGMDRANAEHLGELLTKKNDFVGSFFELKQNYKMDPMTMAAAQGRNKGRQ